MAGKYPLPRATKDLYLAAKNAPTFQLTCDLFPSPCAIERGEGQGEGFVNFQKYLRFGYESNRQCLALPDRVRGGDAEDPKSSLCSGKN
jgi:hypothetical protein